jgi:hypothetical protein
VEYGKATEIAMRNADETQDNTETTGTEMGDLSPANDTIGYQHDT